MPLFFTTEEILHNPWISSTEPVSADLPARVEWPYKTELMFEEVRLWEQIYCQHGNISVYAAWDPYAEFYILVYNLFANEPQGIKRFYGIDAAQRLQEELKKFEIFLPENRVWVMFLPTFPT
jgi:hypothetical protein